MYLLLDLKILVVKNVLLLNLITIISSDPLCHIHVIKSYEPLDSTAFSVFLTMKMVYFCEKSMPLDSMSPVAIYNATFTIWYVCTHVCTCRNVASACFIVSRGIFQHEYQFCSQN